MFFPITKTALCTRADFLGHMETFRPDAREKKIPAPRERCRDWKWRLAARYFPALLGAVSSPRGPLTAVFGMGTGVSAPPEPPTKGIGQDGPEDDDMHAWRLSPPRHGMRRTAGGRRESRTAYQNASAERVAALAPCACQPGSLPGAFRGLRLGRPVFGGAWRLDAFSAYPFATWLPGRADGSTTGAPEVARPWSSRTRGRSRQSSCACGG